MKNIRITYNQIELLEIIESFRFLPLKVLTKITKKKGLYSYRQSLQKAISKLEERGLLKSFYYGNNWKVVYLTTKGGRMLADARGIQFKNISVPNQGYKVQFAMLEHTVKVAMLYNDFLKELKSYPHIKLEKWIGDQRMNMQYTFRINRSGKKKTRILSPDSYFNIQVDKDNYHYFLEYDTGTMDKTQLSFKFMRYFEYFMYGNWKENFNTYPKILFLTERSKKRIDNLIPDEEFDFEKALKNRGCFDDSKNVINMAIANSSNLMSISSADISNFLDVEIIFSQITEEWAKQVLKRYQ